MFFYQMSLKEKLWGFSLHAGCTMFFTFSVLSVGIQTKEMIFPYQKIEQINYEKVSKEISKSTKSWKESKYDIQDYLENQKDTLYSFQDSLGK